VPYHLNIVDTQYCKDRILVRLSNNCTSELENVRIIVAFPAKQKQKIRIVIDRFISSARYWELL
jgi:hypothetical protein